MSNPRDARGRAKRGSLFVGARVYLSGPMDFVASREDERKAGWRARVGEFLRDLGAVVFDPWKKPEVRGLHGYGREDDASADARLSWTFDDSRAGARARASITGKYWETLHIDLRMVDTSDLVIAYCPTNVYSVGTPHEIALCRQQHKPVLFVSPPIEFPALSALEEHLRADERGSRLLQDLKSQVPIQENAGGIPSLWYMALVSGEGFFDGFGFEPFARRYRWPETALDLRERGRVPRRPLLPFLEAASKAVPRRWDDTLGRYVPDDDWLLWDLREARARSVEDSFASRGRE